MPIYSVMSPMFVVACVIIIHKYFQNVKYFLKIIFFVFGKHYALIRIYKKMRSGAKLNKTKQNEAERAKPSEPSVSNQTYLNLT